MIQVEKMQFFTILCLTVLLKKMSVDVTYKEKNNLTICSKFVLVTLNEVITVRYQFSCDEKVIHTKYVQFRGFTKFGIKVL